MTQTRTHENERLRNAAGEIVSYAAMAILRGAGAVVQKWEDHRDLRLLKQGIVGGVEGQRADRKLGLAAERAAAVKNLHKSIDERFTSLSSWRVGEHVVTSEVEQTREDGMFSIETPAIFQGEYSHLYLFDPRPESTGKVFIVQKHSGIDNETPTYTFTSLNGRINPDGSRDGSVFVIGEQDWKAGSPQVQISEFTRIDDQLDDKLLTGDLFVDTSLSGDLAQQVRNTNPLLSAGSQRSTGYEMMSVDAAMAFTELVPNLMPIRW